MRPSVLASVVFLLVASPNFSQQSTSQTSSQSAGFPIRDLQALQVISRAIAAGSLTTGFQFQDVTASGAITYHWAGKDIIGTVQLQCKGNNEVRLDATLPSGTRSWFVNQGSGSTKEPDGSIRSIPLSVAANLGLFAAPHLVLSAIFNDVTTGVTFVGQQQFNGHSAYHVRVTHNFTSWDPSSVNASWSTMDYFIDSVSNLVVATQTSANAPDFPWHVATYEIDYDDYQQFGAQRMPTSITERVGGQAVWNASFNSFVFNTGVSDSLFQF